MTHWFHLARTLVTAGALVGGLAAPGLADDLPFNPDRPGFADSTGAAPPLHVIVEGGVTVGFPDQATVVTAPNGLVRLGLVEGLEARLVLPTYNRISPDSGDAIDGFGDLGVGAKYAFGAGPIDLSVIATVVVPTGGDDFTGDAVNGALSLNYGATLSPTFSVGGVAGADLVEGADGERALGTFGSLGASASLGDAGLYLEAFGVRPEGGPLGAAINLGATYAIAGNAQVDATFTLGLDKGPDNGINVGTSWLW